MDGGEIGLDVWIEPELDKPPSAEDVAAFAALGNVPLSGWMVENDFITFRGKAYEDFVLRVCNISLYWEWISPDEVSQMAQALQALDYNSEWVQEVLLETDVSEREARALSQVLSLCAQRCLGLHGNW